MSVPSLGFTDNFPNRRMWDEIAKEFSGEFKIEFDSGQAIEIHKVFIPYKKWIIKISVSDARPLKFEIAFPSILDFEMIISREDFIEKILKKIGKPEIELGWKEFDDKYLVKSNRSELVKKTITRDIQETLLRHDVYSLICLSHKASGTSGLTSVIRRNATDKKAMTELIGMFRSLLDNFEKARII